MWFKILIIVSGIIMISCAIYALFTESKWGSICLSIFGTLIVLFGVMLFLYHHTKVLGKVGKMFAPTSSPTGSESLLSPIPTGLQPPSTTGNPSGNGGYYYL